MLKPETIDKEWFKFISAVHLFLIKDGKVLLLRRFNTGYEDGNYSVPAGHIDGNERATQAMVREAREEVGIMINQNDLKMVHVMHRKKSMEERIDFFFVADKWQGNPKIMEPHKCDDLSWVPIDRLPQNVIPYVRTAVENYRNNTLFSEFGWS